MPGLEVEPFAVRAEEAKFDLTLLLTERPDGSLGGNLVFAVDLFDHATATRLARHYTTLLEAVVPDGGQRLSELELLVGAERGHVLAEWSGAASLSPDAATTAHRLVEERAAQLPGTTAVLSETEGLTYQELNERANRLARHLRSLGAGPDRVVAVCLERGPDQVTALLAALKSGAAYLPLDPELPADRLAFMIEDSGAAHVVTDSARTAQLPRTPHRFLTDRDWPRIQELAGARPGARRHPAGSGLPDLHQRLHRPPQGGADRAPEPRQPDPLDGGELRGGAGPPDRAPRRNRLRRGGVGGVARAGRGCDPVRTRRHGAAHTRAAPALAGRMAGAQHVSVHTHAGGAGHAGLVGAHLAGPRPDRR